MNTSALFIISTDPRASGQPAEAVRIAAGLAPWRKVDVTLYLRGPAVLVLGENTADLVDGENYSRYLPLLLDLSHPVLAQMGTPLLPQPTAATLPYLEISDTQLAALAADHPCVLRF